MTDRVHELVNELVTEIKRGVMASVEQSLMGPSNGSSQVSASQPRSSRTRRAARAPRKKWQPGSRGRVPSWATKAQKQAHIKIVKYK